MSGRKESVAIDKGLEKDVSRKALEISENANTDEFVERANEPHKDIATLADAEVIVTSQHANQNSLGENFVDVNINEGGASIKDESLRERLEASENVSSGMKQLVRQYYLTVIVTNAILFVINFALTAVCLYGPLEMPFLPGIQFDISQLELTFPLFSGMHSSAISFDRFNLCSIICIVIAPIGVLLSGFMYYHCFSQASIRAVESQEHDEMISESKKQAEKSLKISTKASGSNGSMDSFQANEVSAWLNEEIRHATKNENATNESKNELADSIHKDADEYSGSMNDGENSLIRFVTNNAALVFWANCFLTTLNTALIVICYCGGPTLSILNICKIAPINILCNMIRCMINCSKN